MAANGTDTLYEFYLHTIATNDYRARASVEQYWRFKEAQVEEQRREKIEREQRLAAHRYDQILAYG